MSSNRVLLWLFVAASVVVDLVLLAAVSAAPDVFLYQTMLLGVELGQAGALAIWAITGKVHRLVRAACLVASTGLLALLCAKVVPCLFSQALDFFAVYAILVVGAVGLITFVRQNTANRKTQVKAMRLPLIELFGWTIVVAIASLGIRYMDFEEAATILAYPLSWTALLAVPVTAELIRCHSFKVLHLLIWLVFVIAAYSVGHFLSPLWDGPSVLAAQAAYLAGWMIVRSLANGEPARPQFEPSVRLSPDASAT